jgi:hypothetical protein
MALSDLPPAERHRRIAAGFSDRVHGTEHWGVPSPVTGWTALLGFIGRDPFWTPNR